MGRLWTAERNERLLSIAAFSNCGNDGKAILDTYVKVYGTVDDFRPNPSAIKDQLATLRKKYAAMSGGKVKPAPGGGGGRSSSTTTPRTPKPKSNGATKTPSTSASKRKQDEMNDMSERDDTESEFENDGSPTKMARRSITRGSSGKATCKNYAALADKEEEDEEEANADADAEAEAEAEGESAAGDVIDTSMFDHRLDFDGTTESKPAWLSSNIVSGKQAVHGKGPDTFCGMARGRGKQIRKDNSGDDSDGSEYNPFT